MRALCRSRYRGRVGWLALILLAVVGANTYGQVRLNAWSGSFYDTLAQRSFWALGNELIAILKDTSLLSILSIRDITQRMREFQSASFLPFAPYNSAAIFYILLTLAAASLVSTVERKYDVKHR